MSFKSREGNRTWGVDCT